MNNHDWQETAKSLKRLAQFVKPLSLLEEMPEIIQQAEAENAKLRSTIKNRQAEIEGLDHEIARKNLELETITQEFDDLWAEKMAHLDREIKRRQEQAEERISILNVKISQHMNQLNDLQKQIAKEIQDFDHAKAQAEAELTAKRGELQALNDALAKLLNK